MATVTVEINQSNYVKMSVIELQRQKRDLMYHLIVNTDAKTLDDICNKISNHVLAKYPTASIRLKNMLHKIASSPDRIAKHGLLFFALFQESDTQNVFSSNELQRVPPEKFKWFLEHELPTLVEKLLKGSFTSLRAFVEDARWTYTTL